VEVGKFWTLLGFISLVCVIANAGYVLWWVYDNANERSNIVRAGSILAFIGAMVVLVSSTVSQRRM